MHKQTPTFELIEKMNETDNPVTKSVYRQILANRLNVDREHYSYDDYCSVVAERAEQFLSQRSN